VKLGTTRAVGVVMLAFAIAGAACAKSEADLRQEDRARLEPILVEDESAARAMADADRAQRKGDVLAALDALDSRAKPAIELGLRIATTADARTDWGRSKKELLAKNLEERRAELGPYREAVVSNDVEKLLVALQAQTRIEGHALAAVTAVREGR
jgi:hypothetical protein